MGNDKVCSTTSKLIFACSGAADVGGVSDLAARKLTKDGVGSMFCLAGVGGRVKPILDKTEKADGILALDGCPLDCVKNCLDEAGFTEHSHIRVTDLGLEKGKTELNTLSTEIVYNACRKILEDQ